MVKFGDLSILQTMKGFFLAGSIFFTVLLLIIAFENIGGSCQGFLFLFSNLDQSTSPFFIIMGIALLGAVTGVFFTGLVTQILKNGEDEENPGNW